MRTELSACETWRAPSALAAATLLGLVAALVADEAWDVLWSLLLAVPLAVGGWHWWRASYAR
jgi:xanthosine utilization system XapX-like protein